MSQNQSPAPPQRTRAALLFAFTGICLLTISGYFGWLRYQREHPKPLPHVIAPIPPDQQQIVRLGMRKLAKNILRVSPDQEKRLAAIWEKTPRSVDELIAYQKQTDAILTEQQRAILRPIRRGFQNKVIDKMLEPVGNRLPSADFEKFKDEVKTRVENRISGGA